jgi:hypothetical protein
MASLAEHIERILRESGESLTAVEITSRLNSEFSQIRNPYQIKEIVACAERMPNLDRAGKEYCIKHVA